VCLDAADANDDGCIDCMDGTYIAETLFMGCPQFPPPGNMCGPDPTPDFLGCNESPCP
jgi:hypothetical protein